MKYFQPMTVQNGSIKIKSYQYCLKKKSKNYKNLSQSVSHILVEVLQFLVSTNSMLDTVKVNSARKMLVYSQMDMIVIPNVSPHKVVDASYNLGLKMGCLNIIRSMSKHIRNLVLQLIN